ncbi:TRAP transporter large permease [Stappia indica]|uniref:TRAP transporter large permease n=1 Tax=Stappia indica TaxID=538381 RepID=UPI001CD1FF29|nr:TRAP transporter large permease [Stappia indica]MCA1299733.1 TRAP transporter large permease [Stappia indica]
MSALEIGLVLIGLLLPLILIGLHIGIALMLLSFVGVWMMRGNFELATKLVSLTVYGGISDYIFATIPMFVLMGLLISISNVGKDTFDVAEWALRKIKGGLGVATVLSNTVFAAVTGISIASAAVFTRVAVPEMIRHGYQPKFAVGTVAGSSILGMLIPPSLLLIIYGVLAEESIGRMFVAGVIPGLLMAAAFMAMILIAARVAPDTVIVPGHQVRVDHHETLGSATVKLMPLVALVVLVLGGLYSGYFTPTEAGAVGAAGALVVTVLRRRLTGENSRQVMRETGYISVGILFLLIAAGMYSRMLTMAGIPMEVGNLIAHLGLGVYGFLAVYILLVLLLGMILDSTSILLIVVPIAAPIAKSMGLDLIHFGVISVIAVEIGLLTPPFGISAFTVKSSLDDDSIKVETIFLGALPYVAIMLLVLAFIVVVPGSTTWLARSF